MVTDLLVVAATCAGSAVVAMALVALVIRSGGRVAAMDVLWGPLLAVLALTAAVAGEGLGSPGWPVWVMAAVIVVWAVRLARHIGFRVGHDVEDPRYAELMERPAATLVRSVLLPQGVVAWVVSLPVQAAAVTDRVVAPVVVAGLAAAWGGLVVESVADAQLDRFRREGGSGRLMVRGLWSWSRHPNYFGEAVFWWGVWIMACSSWLGVLTVISPVAMSVVLVWGTGVRLMERRMQGRPGWSEYAARTSVFIPRPPRR